MTSSSSPTAQKIFTAVFLFCFLYWSYLAFVSEMIVVHDSIGYEILGRSILLDGWRPYFENGPKREPLYPLLIAAAMKIGGTTNGSYQPVLKIIQLFILFLTQLLSLRIMKRLGIPLAVSAAVLLYLGISPALLNSALSLYSEIAAYPLILLLILIYLNALARSSPDGKINMAAGWGILFGLTGVALCMVKGIFELIIPLLLLPAVGMSIGNRRTDQRLARNLITFVITAAIIFLGPVNAYKFLNWKYNGNFALTNRAASALYGNTARRTEPLHARQYLAALAFVPGQDFCNTVFSEEECLFWSFRKSDDLSEAQYAEFVRQGLTLPKMGKEYLHLSRERFFQRPFQYALLYLIEGCKMLFWETTTIGFVVYPDWLSVIYDAAIANNFLRLLSFILTVGGLTAGCGLLLKRRAPSENLPYFCERRSFYSFALLLVFFYIGLHSFFLILPRYALPLAPVDILFIALLCSPLPSEKDKTTTDTSLNPPARTTYKSSSR